MPESESPERTLRLTKLIRDQAGNRPAKVRLTPEQLEQERIKLTTPKNYVPCLYLPYLKGSNKLIVFFHGNAEDLGISYEMLDHMRSALKINVMAVEYPNYGVYQDDEGPSEDKIYTDADLVYNFVISMTYLRQKDIILLGRSLGSGPATYLAAKYDPGALILMSPYTSIKSVASNKVGWLSFLLA